MGGRPHLQKHERAAVETYRLILEPLGVLVSVGKTSGGGGHRKVHFEAKDGRTATQTMACSPRADERAIRDFTKQYARRIARDWGLLS